MFSIMYLCVPSCIYFFHPVFTSSVLFLCLPSHICVFRSWRSQLALSGLLWVLGWPSVALWGRWGCSPWALWAKPFQNLPDCPSLSDSFFDLPTWQSQVSPGPPAWPQGPASSLARLPAGFPRLRLFNSELRVQSGWTPTPLEFRLGQSCSSSLRAPTGPDCLGLLGAQAVHKGILGRLGPRVFNRASRAAQPVSAGILGFLYLGELSAQIIRPAYIIK